MTATDADVCIDAQIPHCATGAEFFELTQRGLRLEGSRIGGQVVKSVSVGHATEISREQLRTAIASERSLLASQLRKGRVAAGSTASSIEKMARVTEQALQEAEGAAELAARAAVLHTKGEVSRLAREAAKALSDLAAEIGSSKPNDDHPAEVRPSSLTRAQP